MTKEKSQAATSKAQLCNGKRQGPAARPMDRSLQCRLTVNRSSRGHSAGGHSSLLQMPQKGNVAGSAAAGLQLETDNLLVSASSTCRPWVARHLGPPSVGPAQPCCSPVRHFLQDLTPISPRPATPHSTRAVVPLRKSQHWL